MKDNTIEARLAVAAVQGTRDETKSPDSVGTCMIS